MRRLYPCVFLVLLLVGLLHAARAQETQIGAKQQNADSVTTPAASTPKSSVPAVAPSANTPGTPSSAGAIANDNSGIDENPVTVKTTSDSNSKKAVDTDPLFGVPPLPKGKTTLVGGTVAKIDKVHNRLGVKVFGSGAKWTVAFDERTHFFRDGAETTFEKIKKGERVYVDTMLDGHNIFARNVHIVTHTGSASASGQLTALNNGVMTLHDDLSAQPVRFRVDGQTQVTRDGQSASVADLHEGSLISVQFAPGDRDRGVAREVRILAAPGQSVTFAGKVMNIDLRNNQLAIENSVDQKTYEIAVDGEKSIPSNLMVGSEVTVAAEFDGRGYKARSVSVTAPVASSQ